MQIRLKTLLDTCTYVVFNYTRRGLFDRDKLIVLTLLTFHIMVKVRHLIKMYCSFRFSYTSTCSHAVPAYADDTLGRGTSFTAKRTVCCIFCDHSDS